MVRAATQNDSSHWSSLAEANDPGGKPLSPQAKALLNILNEYETLSMGIKHGILDESYISDVMRSVVIADWQTLEPLVREYRRGAGADHIYGAFEGLASAWKRNVSYRDNRSKLNKSRRRIWIS